MIQVEKGIISLDDELKDILPDYKLWEGVKVKHLLGHTSGIPAYLFSLQGLTPITDLVNNRNHQWGMSDLIDGIKYLPLEFKPGSEGKYNNSNFVLLGMILEKATNRKLEELYKTEIFEPLNMTNSFYILPENKEKNLISGYVEISSKSMQDLLESIIGKIEVSGSYVGTKNTVDLSLSASAGRIISNSIDVSKFTNALFSGELVSKSTLDIMMQFRSIKTFLGRSDFGLGISQVNHGKGSYFGHGGLSPGYQTVSYYLKDKDISYTLMQSTGPGPLYALSKMLSDKILTDKKLTTTEFTPHPDLALENLKEGIHLRIKNTLDETRFEKIKPLYSIGKSYVKSGSQVETPFSQYKTSLFTDRDGKEYISILSAEDDNEVIKNYFFPFIAKKKNKKTEFLEVIIDKKAFIESEEKIFLDVKQNTDLISAYKGTLSQKANGKSIRCISEVLDQDKVQSFQLETDSNQKLQVSSTVKFVANLHLKKASESDLLNNFYAKGLKLCSDKKASKDTCSNVAPSKQFTCEQQASWGKCGEPWMNNFCNRSCGRCE